MHRTWLPAALSLVLGLPLAALASTDAPRTPERLVVDSVSAPVLSVKDGTRTVEIVLVPDAEYQPVHPDSVDTKDDAPGAETSAPARGTNDAP